MQTHQLLDLPLPQAAPILSPHPPAIPPPLPPSPTPSAFPRVKTLTLNPPTTKHPGHAVAFRIYDLDNTGHIERGEIQRFLAALLKDNPAIDLDNAHLDALIDSVRLALKPITACAHHTQRCADNRTRPSSCTDNKLNCFCFMLALAGCAGMVVLNQSGLFLCDYSRIT